MKRESRHVIDEWLVLKAQSGDVEALAALLKRHQQPMLRHAYRLTGNADAAQDIWQESVNTGLELTPLRSFSPV